MLLARLTAPPLIFMLALTALDSHAKPLPSSTAAIVAEQCDARILEGTRSAVLNRSMAEYDLLIGDFSVEHISGTGFAKLLPAGSGVHVLEIGWIGRSGAAQHIAIPSSGALYLSDRTIIVDFQSFVDTEFVDDADPMPFCDGVYSNVLLVTVSGTCWGPKKVTGDVSKWKCNASSGTACNSTIQFTGTPPPADKHPEFDCQGEGTIDFNPVTQVANVVGAASGC